MSEQYLAKRELTAPDILVASFDGLLPLILLVGVALVQSTEREHAGRRMQPNLLACVVLAVNGRARPFSKVVKTSQSELLGSRGRSE